MVSDAVQQQCGKLEDAVIAKSLKGLSFVPSENVNGAVHEICPPASDWTRQTKDGHSRPCPSGGRYSAGTRSQSGRMKRRHERTHGRLHTASRNEQLPPCPRAPKSKCRVPAKMKRTTDTAMQRQRRVVSKRFNAYSHQFVRHRRITSVSNLAISLHLRQDFNPLRREVRRNVVLSGLCGSNGGRGGASAGKESANNRARWNLRAARKSDDRGGRHVQRIVPGFDDDISAAVAAAVLWYTFFSHTSSASVSEM